MCLGESTSWVSLEVITFVVLVYHPKDGPPQLALSPKGHFGSLLAYTQVKHHIVVRSAMKTRPTTPAYWGKCSSGTSHATLRSDADGEAI